MFVCVVCRAAAAVPRRAGEVSGGAGGLRGPSGVPAEPRDAPEGARAQGAEERAPGHRKETGYAVSRVSNAVTVWDWHLELLSVCLVRVDALVRILAS